MEKFVSKPAVVNYPPDEVYANCNRLDLFDDQAEKRLADWKADADSCSFRVAGFPTGMRIVERIPGKLVRMASIPESAFTYYICVTFTGLPEGKTAIQHTLEIELNMVLRMMIGDRIGRAIDEAAEIAANYLNATLDGAARHTENN